MGAGTFQKAVRLGLKNERSEREDRGAEGVWVWGAYFRATEQPRSKPCAKTISNKSNFYLHQQRSVAIKYAKNALAAGALPGTPLGELTTLPPSRPARGHPLTRPYSSILALAALVFKPEPYHFLKHSGAHVCQ